MPISEELRAAFIEVVEAENWDAASEFVGAYLGRPVPKHSNLTFVLVELTYESCWGMGESMLRQEADSWGDFLPLTSYERRTVGQYLDRLPM
jgi:hypothetical protein